MKDIPSGSYIIEEADDMYFDFVDMKALNSAEGFSFEKEGLNYVLTIDEKQAVKILTTYSPSFWNLILQDWKNFC